MVFSEPAPSALLNNAQADMYAASVPTFSVARTTETVITSQED